MQWIRRRFPKQPTSHLHHNSAVPNATRSIRAAPTAAAVTKDTESRPCPRPSSPYDPSTVSNSLDVDEVEEGVTAVRNMIGRPLAWMAGGVDGTEVDIENDAQLEAELMRDAYPPDGIPPPTMPNGDGRGDGIGAGSTDIEDNQLQAELMGDMCPTGGIPPPKQDSEYRCGRKGTGPIEHNHEQQQKQQQQKEREQEQEQEQGVVNEISSGLLDRIIAEGEVERRLKQQQVSSSDMLGSSDMGWISKLGDDDDEEVAQAANILQQTVQARRL